MKWSYKKVISILVLFLIGIFPLFPADYEKALNEFLKTSGVPSSSLAIKIIDISNNDVLISHNSDLPLTPASIMKSVTTAALLDKAGPDWQYHTRVFIDGPNDLGFLRGNLIIEGACDPTLNSEKEPYSTDLVEEICNALTAQLITQIEGSIIIDESEFDGSSRPESWASGDFKKYYGTGSHAFNYSDNARGDFAVEEPSISFISYLKEALANNGIELLGEDLQIGRKTQIFDHVSAPLDEIMRSCMMRSDNLFAESMLRTYGKLEGGDGSTDQAAQKLMTYWEKESMPLDGIIIVDGSGLSRVNKMTANFMTELLKRMSVNADYASFFPLAGQEGTLKKFLADTSLDSYIAMKTGSMNGIQCYAGYKLDDDYMPTHVIVMILNDVPKSRQKTIKAAQKMLLDIFE